MRARSTCSPVLTGDFSDVHMDAEVMKETEFGGRIGHGILALGIMQGLMWQTNYNLGTAVATLGWNNVKSSAPLRAGDTVQAHWSIESKRESQSRPQMGILMEGCHLVNSTRRNRPQWRTCADGAAKTCVIDSKPDGTAVIGARHVT